MIDVTVKTLDSQNHNYSVPDDITVEDFKEKISSSVNVPANLQRLIYCGRVLLDDKKLNDYDVNGKVIHLVQRPPPSLSSRPDNQSGSISSTTTFPRLQNTRHFTTPDGNQVYVGAFSIPTDNEDNIAPNLPFTPVVSLGQSSSAVRLGQARKMLQKCNRILDVLSNENSEPETESPAAEETLPEVASDYSQGRWRVTNYAYPNTHQLVLAAQATAIASAVQAARAAGIPNITIVQASGSSTVPPIVTPDTVSDSNVQTMQVDVENPSSSQQAESEQLPEESVAAGSEMRVTSGETEGVGAKPKRLQTRNNDGIESTSDSRSPENNESTPGSREPSSGNEQPNVSNSDPGTGDRHSGHPPTSRMVEVLDLLRDVNNRLQPYLQEYYSLMQADPANNNDAEQQKNQSTFNKVSEILHYLSHAYHAISDIMCDFTLPPPRELRGRPFVVQQPIMDSTIPIQFDAHINVTAANNSGDIDGRGPNENQEQQSQLPSSQNPGVMVMEVNSDNGTQESGSSASIANGVTSGPQLLQQIIQMMRGGSIGMSISNGSSDTPLAQQGQTTQARSGSETTSTASTRTRTTARPHIHPMAIPLPVPSNVYDPFLQCTSHHWFPTDNNNGSSRRPQTNPVIGATIDIHPVLNFFHGRQDLRSAPRISLGGLGGSTEQSRVNNGTASSQINNGSQRNVPNSVQPDSPTLNRSERTQAGDAASGQGSGDPNVQALNRQIQDIFQYIEGNLNSVNVRHSMRVHSDPPRSGNTISVSLNAQDGINIQRPPQNGGNAEATSHFTTINSIIQDMFGQTEQMAQIAQQLLGARDSGNGDNLIDLIGNISLPDIDNILSGNFESLTPLLEPLRAYITDRILHGQEPTEANIHQGMQAYTTEWRRWIQIAEREARQQMTGPSPMDNVDFTATMENFLLSQSTQAIRSLFAPVNAEGSGTSFLTRLQTFSDQMIALCLHFFNNSRNVLMVVMERFLDTYIRGRGQLVTQIANMFIRPRMQNLNLDVSAPMSEIQGYLIPRRITTPTHTAVEASDSCDNMDVDNEMPDNFARTDSWQAILPTDWVPIINQDICHQRRHSSSRQAPFSDAYLEGMPSKRRKMATHNKPRESLNHSLSALVRTSIRHLGLTPTTSDEQVVKDIVDNSELNQTYDQNLKSMIGERIKKDDNYLPSKYPFTENYISK